MKLGYFLVAVGFIAIFGGLINTAGGCFFVGVSFFTDPFSLGRSIGTLFLGLVLLGLGMKRLAKQKPG